MSISNSKTNLLNSAYMLVTLINISFEHCVCLFNYVLVKRIIIKYLFLGPAIWEGMKKFINKWVKRTVGSKGANLGPSTENHPNVVHMCIFLNPAFKIISTSLWNSYKQNPNFLYVLRFLHMDAYEFYHLAVDRALIFAHNVYGSCQQVAWCQPLC